ncbi:MAG TPA: F0F1 ATP synthase subunit B [Acidimicrobiales bacterium]|nr:F0F1 ATP synthase subunit B [Acidimicrobiales bacterium]
MLGVSVFLLPNGTYVVELLVFAAVLWVMAKKVMPRFNAILDARQEKVRASLAAADEARAAAAATDEERSRVLAEARERARVMTEEAQALADQVRAEAATRGQAEYDRIVTTARAEVAAARQRAIDDASARVGEIVFDLVTKVVEREVDQAAHQDLVNEAVATLRAEAARGATS